MKLRSIVGALTWIAIATATLESDSRGNRSNEKESNYEERAINDRTKEIVDDSPPILDTSESIERVVEPGNGKKPDNRLTDKNAENREADKQPANEAVRPDASPSLTTRATERSVDETRKNVTTSTRSRANETEQILPRHSTVTSDDSAGPDSESNDLGNPNSNEQSDLRNGADFGQRVRSLPAWRSRSNEDAGTARLGPSDARVFPDNSRKQRGKKNVATKHVDASEYPFLNEEEELDGASSRNSLAEEYTGGVRNEDATGTPSREAPLSFGKFSGPIVVADLPRRTKYSFGKTEYAIAAGDDDEDERSESKSTYPAALSNRPRAQDSNSLVNEPIASLDRPESSLSGTIDAESRHRPSESVASDAPHSVEIQKSLELFHTAPVHEIHYPLEFVPYVQRAGSAKKRPRQRPGQTNAYRTNEIPDGERYEYNANEDERSASNSVTRPTDDKPAVDLRDDSEYDQTAGTYSRIERIPERVAERNEFDPPKGIIAKFLGIESSSSAPGNLQDPPELLEDPSLTESSFLRRYPAEKLYPHRAINTDDGKPPNHSEKVIEKQITIPQPYLVHVPVDRVVEKQIRIPYPVHMEKLIEKKMPFAIQRLIVPIPVHFRIPQPIPIPIPVPVEKPIDDRLRARPSDAENVAPYPPENPKPANIFKQVPRPPNFRSPYENDYFNSTVIATTASVTPHFHGTGYSSVNRPFARQQQILHASPNNKFRYPQSILYTSSNDNNDNIVFYGRTFPEKDQTIDEYVGPVPRKVQPSLGMRSKLLQYAATDVQSTIRRTRQEGNIGAFRQSKMEYGFKPPMVPSIQYDEQTATKVD